MIALYTELMCVRKKN